MYIIWEEIGCNTRHPSSTPAPELRLFFSFKMPVNKYFKLRCQFWGRRSVQMAGKRKKGRPAKTLIQPTIIESGLYPAIAVPMSLIGKHILVPGSYWPRSGQNREELATLYQCVVREYTSVHKFLNGKSSPAWQVQEMGTSGTGSLELGDSSGDIFWMSKSDFVPLYWKTHPRGSCSWTSYSNVSSTLGHQMQP